MVLSIRAFAAGAALPALLMPLILIFFSQLGFGSHSEHSYFHFIPLIWGVWNILCQGICKRCLPASETSRMAISGIVLALLIAGGATYLTTLPSLVSSTLGIPWIALVGGITAVYSLVWATLLQRINHLVGLS